MTSNILSVTPTLLSVGTHGPYETDLITSDVNGYVITLQNNTDWPISNDVMEVLVEISSDNGKSWQFDAKIVLSSGTWIDKKTKSLTNTSHWVVRDPPNTNKLRVTLNVLQAVTFGFSGMLA